MSFLDIVINMCKLSLRDIISTRLFLYIIFALSILSSCNSSNDNSEYRYGDYRKFSKTPIAELAQYVESGDTDKVTNYLRLYPKTIDYQEPYDSLSLLMITIINQRKATFPYSIICDNENCGLSLNEDQCKSFHNLLNNGASVNTVAKDGDTPLMLACGCDYYDVSFVRELIAHGADVNYILPAKHANRIGNSTPLQNAIKCHRFDFVKILVENGADVNYMDVFGNTPLGMSLQDNNYSMTLYLLKNGGDYTVPIVDKSIHTGNLQDTSRLTLAEELRYHVHPLDSKEYMLKMQIVSFLRDKGIDYRKIAIPNAIKLDIKGKYPNTWKNIIQLY